jgi:predicted dinucleotide-binding enzyme
MKKISIVGSGKMAQGISSRMVAAQQQVTIYDRTMLASGAITGDIVIFALPYSASLEVVKAHAKELAGKIVVDISNPVNFQTFELLTPAGSSAAEEIAKLLPHSSIIKAFNTTFANTLADSKPVSVDIAGDDTVAKEALTKILESAGVNVIDNGALSHARTLEKTAQENIRKMYGPK